MLQLQMMIEEGTHNYRQVIIPELITGMESPIGM
jgi:hypothetical protein